MTEFELERLVKYNLAEDIFDSLFSIETDNETLPRVKSDPNKSAEVLARIQQVKNTIAKQIQLLGSHGKDLNSLNTILLSGGHQKIPPRWWKFIEKE